jgi:hypothetical protein
MGGGTAGARCWNNQERLTATTIGCLLGWTGAKDRAGLVTLSRILPLGWEGSWPVWWCSLLPNMLTCVKCCYISDFALLFAIFGALTFC